jgi:putative toxin-antitoxin system antitoxin component (TIGR02293 family)
MKPALSRDATGNAMESEAKRILAIATDAFDDEALARRWLSEPNIQLGNRRPIDVIGTAEGRRAVEIVLNQIKYAIFA